MWAEFCDIYSEDNNEEVIKVNGVKFYYNPKELNIDDYIEILRNFPADEEAYSIYI